MYIIMDEQATLRYFTYIPSGSKVNSIIIDILHRWASNFSYQNHKWWKNMYMTHLGFQSNLKKQNTCSLEKNKNNKQKHQKQKENKTKQNKTKKTKTVLENVTSRF